MEVGGVFGYGGINTYAPGAAAQAPAMSALAPANDGAAVNAQGAQAAADPDSARLAQEKAYAKVMGDKFNQECQTCKNRTYQDGSNDPGVSFKNAAHIDPGVSASVVMGHEQEHVAHEQAKANREGGRVVSSSVRLHGATCPECGRYYIAGGVTETKVRYGGEKQSNESGNAAGQGGGLDITA